MVTRRFNRRPTRSATVKEERLVVVARAHGRPRQRFPVLARRRNGHEILFTRHVNLFKVFSRTNDCYYYYHHSPRRRQIHSAADDKLNARGDGTTAYWFFLFVLPPAKTLFVVFNRPSIFSRARVFRELLARERSRFCPRSVRWKTSGFSPKTIRMNTAARTHAPRLGIRTKGHRGRRYARAAAAATRT